MMEAAMIVATLGAVIITGVLLFGAGFWLGWIMGFDAGAREVADITDEKSAQAELERRRKSEN